MEATILYKTDHMHSYKSRDLIGVFISMKKLNKIVHKIVNEDQWDNPRELDTKEELKNYIQWNIDFFMEKGQTQGLNDFELYSEKIVLNQLL